MQALIGRRVDMFIRMALRQHVLRSPEGQLLGILHRWLAKAERHGSVRGVFTARPSQS